VKWSQTVPFVLALILNKVFQEFFGFDILCWCLAKSMQHIRVGHQARGCAMAAHNSQHTRIAQLQHCIQAMMRHEIREELDALDQHD